MREWRGGGNMWKWGNLRVKGMWENKRTTGESNEMRYWGRERECEGMRGGTVRKYEMRVGKMWEKMDERMRKYEKNYCILNSWCLSAPLPDSVCTWIPLPSADNLFLYPDNSLLHCPKVVVSGYLSAPLTKLFLYPIISLIHCSNVFFYLDISPLCWQIYSCILMSLCSISVLYLDISPLHWQTYFCILMSRYSIAR
jgi:hypothetical protein